MRLSLAAGLLVACVITTVTVLPAPARAQNSLPAPDLIRLAMDYLGFDAKHRDALLAGEVLFTGMPALEPLPQSVAVAGAMLIVQRPWTELIDAYLAEETLRIHREVVAFDAIPPSAQDAATFDALVMDNGKEKELRGLLRAEPGTRYNLSREELARFRDISAGANAVPDADRVLRDVLWQRVADYRTRGLAGVAPYARKGGDEVSPALEMQASLDSARFLAEHFPGLHGALRRYPQGMEGIEEDRLLWIEKATRDGRPLLTLVHRLVQIEEDKAIAAEREFYVGHGYNSLLTLVAVMPHDAGTLVIAANRTFSDRLEGGKLRKSAGRKFVGRKLAEHFAHLRDVLEAE
jgi:hypothetical protein